MVGLVVAPAFAQKDSSDNTPKDRKLRITKALRAIYPEEARQNHIQGTVLLEVTFQSDGTIGEVRCINDDNEDTQKLIKYHVVQAVIEAAKKLEFDPEIKDGAPVTVVKKYEYTLSLY